MHLIHSFHIKSHHTHITSINSHTQSSHQLMDPETPARRLLFSTSYKLGGYAHMGDVIPLTHIHALKTIQFQETSCTNRTTR